MFADHISMLPEFLLLCGMFVLLLAARFRQNTTPKTYFTVSKIAVAAALLGTVFFYNQSFMPGWLINDSYTTLFKTLIYIAALASFYLGCKWFLNKNRSSLSFYLTALFSLLLLTLAVSAQTLLVFVSCLTAAFVRRIRSSGTWILSFTFLYCSFTAKLSFQYFPELRPCP